MRCRAWLMTKYCRNETRGTFCHVHRLLPPYPRMIDTLPSIVLQNIGRFLTTAEKVQQFRLCCRHISISVLRAPFELSLQYKYFQRFFSTNDISVRQVSNACHRYLRLDKKSQNSLKRIPQNIKCIEARTTKDKITFNRDLPVFNRLISRCLVMK